MSWTRFRLGVLFDPEADETLALNRPSIMWVDNEAARLALAKGVSDSPTLQVLGIIAQHIEVGSPSLLWCERVASFSNPADGPSRGALAQTCANLGAAECECTCVATLQDRLLALTAQPLACLPPVV